MMRPKTPSARRCLCYIRDTLIERAHGLRTGFESNPFLYCQSPEGKGDLKRVVAVEAAADMMTFIVGQWQDLCDQAGQAPGVAEGDRKTGHGVVHRGVQVTLPKEVFDHGPTLTKRQADSPEYRRPRAPATVYDRDAVKEYLAGRSAGRKC